MPKYLYTSRPPGIGCQPNNAQECEAFDAAMRTKVHGYDVVTHGRVTYATRLTFDEAWRFDLIPEDRVELNLFMLWKGRYDASTVLLHMDLGDIDLRSYVSDRLLLTAILALKEESVPASQVRAVLNDR